MKTETAMMQLRNKLLEEVERLSDARPNTDQYGYREALRNVAKDIDAQMLEIEKEQIKDAYETLGSEEDSEDWYNEKFNQKK